MQTVGTVTASHKMLSLQALSSSLNAALQREAAWAEERFFGDLRQSVPQNGRVHLHIIEKKCPNDVLEWVPAAGKALRGGKESLQRADAIKKLPSAREYIHFKFLTIWATPPVRLGLSGRNSGKIPERPRKRSQSVSWNFFSRVRLGCPKPYNSRHLRLPERFQNSLPPVRLGTSLFSESVPERASQSWSWNSQQYWGYF